CFSPATTRLPLGCTSTTVTPIEPVKLLLELDAPLSSNLLPVDEEAPRFAVEESDKPNSLPRVKEVLAVLLAESAPCLAAAVFSLRAMVSVSPGSRARRSPNRG